MNNSETGKTTYLAITIGPIYQTIQRAKRTRELWAASFILSQFMYEILCRLQERQYGTALSPDISALDKNNPDKRHGAGIWNDNCFFVLDKGEDKIEALKKELPGLLTDAKKAVKDYIHLNYENAHNPIHLTSSQLSDIFDRHFYCSAVLHSRLPDQDGQEKVLIELGNLLASAENFYVGPERYDDYMAEALFRPETVLKLYNKGFDDHDEVFTKLKGGYRRLPSLLEIATREFKKTKAYDDVVEAISNQYKAQAKKRNDPEPATKDEIAAAIEEYSAVSDDDNAIIDILKGANTDDVAFKKRHKYVAIVQSDGDNISKIIKGYKDADTGKMTGFSAELMRFSKAAVDEIADYGGLPVYAGGDDLLFIAPLQNDKKEHLFDLLKKIKGYFDDQPQLKAGISFGISIFYYKSPMGEALQEGRKQLFSVAKKLSFSARGKSVLAGKNATAFRVLLHGGQAFGAALQHSGPVWDAWITLFDQRKNADTAFLSGMVHRLELLDQLLEDACDHDSAEFFFSKHFNEAGGKSKDFVNDVQKLADAIYREYGALHIDPSDQKDFYEAQIALDAREKKRLPDASVLRRRYCNNLLYSLLRLIQFLNAEDHE